MQSGECFGVVGVSFCSDPFTRIPWKDPRAGRFVTAPGSPLWLVTAGEQMLELQQGVRMIPATRSHTAGRSHGTSSSHTQPAEAGAHWLTTHTTRSGAPQRPTHTYRCSLLLPDIKDEHKCFAPNYVCSWYVLWLLTDRVWIHFKMLLTNQTSCHGGHSFYSRVRIDYKLHRELLMWPQLIFFRNCNENPYL